VSPQRGVEIGLNLARAGSPLILASVNGTTLLTETGTGAVRLGATGDSIGFYGTTPVALQTGVAVTDQGLHDACVALGLFTA
jgi:hypothetical protein